jgi:hypothetical protein
MRPFDCWGCGFESRRYHGCLSLVRVVCCQVEVSAKGRSLVQSNASECGLCLNVIKGNYNSNTYSDWAEEGRLKKKESEVTIY